LNKKNVGRILKKNILKNSNKKNVGRILKKNILKNSNILQIRDRSFMVDGFKILLLRGSFSQTVK